MNARWQGSHRFRLWTLRPDRWVRLARFTSPGTTREPGGSYLPNGFDSFDSFDSIEG